MRILIATVVILWSGLAAALPGAEPGDDCHAHLSALRASGADIDKPDGAAERDQPYFVRAPGAIPPNQAAYWCKDGKITRQFFVLGYSEEAQARHRFLEIRDELERALGKATYDDTNARDRQEFAELSAALGTENDPDLMSGAIMWASGWHLTIENVEGDLGTWRVVISFQSPAGRITTP